MEPPIVPVNRLLYTLDQKGTRKYFRVVESLRQYHRKYLTLLKQHEPVQKAIVDKWHLSEYLDSEVKGTFTLLTIISERSEV